MIQNLLVIVEEPAMNLEMALVMGVLIVAWIQMEIVIV